MKSGVVKLFIGIDMLRFIIIACLTIFYSITLYFLPNQSSNAILGYSTSIILIIYFISLGLEKYTILNAMKQYITPDVEKKYKSLEIAYENLRNAYNDLAERINYMKKKEVALKKIIDASDGCDLKSYPKLDSAIIEAKKVLNGPNLGS
jgi:hypothetical protein